MIRLLWDSCRCTGGSRSWLGGSLLFTLGRLNHCWRDHCWSCSDCRLNCNFIGSHQVAESGFSRGRQLCPLVNRLQCFSIKSACVVYIALLAFLCWIVNHLDHRNQFSVQVQMGGNVVTLPKVLRWFHEPGLIKKP